MAALSDRALAALATLALMGGVYFLATLRPPSPARAAPELTLKLLEQCTANSRDSTPLCPRKPPND